MLKLKSIALIALFMSAAMLASADVTGKWSGTALAKTPDGNTEESAAWMSLVQTGNSLTGTAGETAERQAPIKDGKVDGDSIEFKVSVGDDTATVRVKLDGDRMKGVAVVETADGRVTAELNLKRVP